MTVHDSRIRTVDLTHTKQQIIPQRYKREHIGDIDGSYRVYIHCVGYLLAGDGHPARVPLRPPLRTHSGSLGRGLRQGLQPEYWLDLP